jgi:NADPH-dependent glutamate synthase beta subunit-like oxidoreductase/NAD(P)H-flavin reductase
MELGFSLTFSDLYTIEGLKKLDQFFIRRLLSDAPELYQALMLARSGEPLEPKTESQLMICLGGEVENFIAELFTIHKEVDSLRAKHNHLAPLYKCKRDFIRRKVSKAEPTQDFANIAAVSARLAEAGIDLSSELSFAKQVLAWQEKGEEAILEDAKYYALWAMATPMGKAKHKHHILFRLPEKIDPAKLIKLDRKGERLYSAITHPRDGFKLTDKGYGLNQVLDQANYCIYCHNQGKDSCAHGMKDKTTGDYQVNELGVKLTGCPLEERISEMNNLKSEANSIGALAAATVDNPMLAATGHRICNDCMKACIYQKQEPVNIPMIETGILNDVLSLPWGFEIYSLLTRWNPLNFLRPLPELPHPYKILVVGLGPAGFTLSHHLLNRGYIVVGIDGLKIEPLPKELVGPNFKPIKDVQQLFQELDKRPAGGFGGVAEYGITVRWNKNYLTLIRMLLERRSNFTMYGGIRFGENGTISQQLAFDDLRFDHIALALGAGRPNLLNIPNIMARGVRAASDFLMSLQLTGAGKMNSLANLQIRLPVVVIGGGLTAIDTATESLAYYPIQVEKVLQQYEELGEVIFEEMDEEERFVTQEFLNHAQRLRRVATWSDKLNLLKEWGGVTVAYRKGIEQAPSYRLNHEEVALAFEEGIELLENIEPRAVLVDHHGTCRGISYDGGEIAARTVLIAAGTHPNTVLAREAPSQFKLDAQGRYFQALELDKVTGDLKEVKPERCAKPQEVHIFTAMESDYSNSISFLGDLHPSYVGNVVKAMASAKQGAPAIDTLVKKITPKTDQPAQVFFDKLDNLLSAQVYKVERLTPTIVEVVIRAPLAAQQFQPGQFYRLQNYETFSTSKNGYNLTMEGLAMTGAWVDKEQGLVSIIALEMGGSSNLCSLLKKDESVVLMGPTGAPTEIPKDETVMLVGGGLGNAVLFSIGKAMRENGCRVLYFAGYKKLHDRYKIEEIEQAADIVIWACDEEGITKRRNQDQTFCGNILQAIEAYGEGKLEGEIKLADIDRIIAIGSDRMMKAVAHARHNALAGYFKKGHVALGSINSPMQCMMKEICAQCIQRHVDPVTGQEEYVYSCFNQDQALDIVDFDNLQQRLRQNSAQEKITKKVLQSCLGKR